MCNHFNICNKYNIRNFCFFSRKRPNDYINSLLDSEQSGNESDDSVIDYISECESSTSESDDAESSDSDANVEEVFVTTKSGRKTTSWKACNYR